MHGHLDLVGALRLIAAGRKIPREKWNALQRAHLIVVRGPRGERTPELTEAGRERLAASPPPPATAKPVRRS